jgi:bisphosphoglycerate-dependent phosphoglycerate mutase
VTRRIGVDMKNLELEVSQQTARVLLPAIAQELKNEGKFLTTAEADALRALVKEINFQLTYR